MFLKRSQVLKNYEFPRSFAGNVIVKAKKSGIGFREDYPEELKNELAFEEFSDVIGRINKACEDVYIKKRVEEAREHDTLIKILMNVSIFLVVFSFMFAIMTAFQDDLSKINFPISVSLIAIGTYFLSDPKASLIMFSVIIYSLFKVTKFMNAEQVTAEEIKNILDEVNRQHRKDYKLEWSTSANLYWISIKSC